MASCKTSTFSPTNILRTFCHQGHEGYTGVHFMMRCSYRWETGIVFVNNDYLFSGGRSVNFVVNNICGNIKLNKRYSI